MRMFACITITQYETWSAWILFTFKDHEAVRNVIYIWTVHIEEVGIRKKYCAFSTHKVGLHKADIIISKSYSNLPKHDSISLLLHKIQYYQKLHQQKHHGHKVRSCSAYHSVYFETRSHGQLLIGQDFVSSDALLQCCI